MTAMVTSEKAKEQPRDVRQKILAFLRDKYCPSVDDENWAQIAKDINETKELLTSETMKYMVSSMNNDGSMKEDKAAMELEKTVKEHKDDIDLDKLKEDTQDVGVKQTIDEIKELDKTVKDPISLAEQAYEEAKAIKELDETVQDPISLAEHAYEEAKAEEFKPAPKDSKEIDRQFEELKKRYDEIQTMSRDIHIIKDEVGKTLESNKTVEEKRLDDITPKKKKKYDFFGRRNKDKNDEQVEGGGKKKWFGRS